jgi:probable HAF family extracellular repeat protein
VRGLNNRGDITGNFQLSANDPGTGFITPRYYGQPITFKAPDPTTTAPAPEAVNDLRPVVGWCCTSFCFHGFLRTPSGKFIDIVFLGSILTRAFGNDCGVIVGRYRLADNSRHGFYGRYGHLQSLDVPSSIDTTADGINNEGRIVGQFIDSNGTPHAYVTSKVDGAGCE